MKKLLLTVIMVVFPSSIFAIGGLGLSVGSATFSVDESFSPMMVLEQEVGYFHQHSFENGGSFGGYLYLDIIPVLGGLDIEINGLVSPYNFTFYNDAMELANVEPDTFKFIFAAGNTYITIQKPIFKLGIPFLAKAKLFAGGGFNRHAAIPIINQEMMESVVLDEDGNTDLAEGEFNSDALIDYLEKNMFEATGVHFQGGLQFRLLTFDLFAYYRYTIAKDVVPGNAGFSSMNMRLGLGI